MCEELRKRGIEKGLKVVYFPELPLKPDKAVVDCKDYCTCPGGKATCLKKRQIPGSMSFGLPVSGLLLAGAVTNDLINRPRHGEN